MVVPNYVPAVPARSRYFRSWG